MNLKDALEPAYPRFVDRACLVNLSAKLNPDQEVVLLQAETQQTTNRGQPKEAKILDGYGVLLNKHTEVMGRVLKIDCLNKKQTKIEQSFKFSDVANDLADAQIPEMVINHAITVQEPNPECPIYDQFGLRNILAIQERDGGNTPAWLPKKSLARYMIDKIISQKIDYPISNVSKHLRSVRQTYSLTGLAEDRLIPCHKIIPKRFGYQILEKLYAPWLDGKFWLDIFYPTIGCRPVFESKVTGDYFGSKKLGEDVQ